MAFILFIVFFLTLLLLLCVIFSNNIMRPEILFVSGFLVQSVYAILYVYKMDIYLHVDTVVVLLGGISLFVFSSWVFSIFFKNLFRTGELHGEISEPKYQTIHVETWLLVLFFVAETISNVSFLWLVLKVSGSNSISEAMRYWDYTNKFTDVTLDKPTIISLLGIFTGSATLVQLYLFAHQLIYKYSTNRFWLLVNIILGGTYTLIGGARQGIIEYSFIFILFLYYIYKDKYYWKRKIKARLIIPIVFVAGILILFLCFSGELMGRGKQSDIGHYLFIYLSAELKNLDIFVRKHIFGTDIAHSQTIVSLRLYLAKRYGFSGWGSKLDIPFQSVNGLGLGNVYTIFYMFLYDDGLIGLVFYTVIMAAITQMILHWSLLSGEKTHNTINYALIVYGVIAFATLFSFFSDKFYELIFDIGFIRKMIITFAICLFINRFRLIKYNNLFVFSYKYRFILLPRKADKKLMQIDK